jgi:hypothetical protein
MTVPEKNPGKRLRKILSSQKRDGQEEPEPQGETQDLLARLPKARSAEPEPAAPADEPGLDPTAPVSSLPPGFVMARRPKTRLPRRLELLPAFWTIGSVLSILINIVLLAFLVIALRQLGALRSLSGGAGAGLLGGLYGNFERMDQAHIRSTIPVQALVPVVLDVCIKTGTDVVLSQDVSIPNARVTVQTGGLNISNATTAILLPADTRLPVNLDFCVPVQTQIPVALNVDVDIPIANTELHAAIQGLKDTIKPLYCLAVPNATSVVDGLLICR